jgi:hypothetical protein
VLRMHDNIDFVFERDRTGTTATIVLVTESRLIPSSKLPQYAAALLVWTVIRKVTFTSRYIIPLSPSLSDPRSEKRHSSKKSYLLQGKPAILDEMEPRETSWRGRWHEEREAVEGEDRRREDEMGGYGGRRGGRVPERVNAY